MSSRLLLVMIVAAFACGVAAADTRHGVAVVAPAAPEGALMTPETLESQAGRAGLIVVGRVTDVDSRSQGATIETQVRVKLSSSIKGNGPSEVKLTLPGGTVGSTSLQVGGVPNFLAGERVLLLLESAANPKLMRLWESKYSLAGGQAHQPGERPSISIKSLEDQLGAALGKKVSIPSSATEEVVQAFTVSCPDWPTASLPVKFKVNAANAAPSGPTGSTFRSVAYESWHAWQALSNSFPAFSYSGTTAISGHAIDGTNAIGWADLDSLGSGVLGVNYCAYTVDSGGNPVDRVDSDTIIDNDRTWDWVDSNGITGFSLRAVMEHELGHGLSLGHSNVTCDGTANTPLMCPSVSSGVRKTIKADDQAGAASLYPLSGSPPGAPSGVNAVDDGSSFSVSWNASSGSPIAYDIERGNSTCSGSWVAAGTVPASATSFVDDDFGAGLPGDYCYRVKALGVGGDSGWASQSAFPTYVAGSSEHELTAVALGSGAGIFGRTTANQLTFSETSGGSFGSWTNLATDVASRPEAVVRGSDVFVFFRSTGNDIRYVRRTSSSWAPAVSLGGIVAGSPSAAVDGDGDLLVVSLNSSGKVWYRLLSGGTWSPWTNVSGTLSGDVILIENQGDIFLVGLTASGQTYVRTWDGTTNSWGSWLALNGTLSGKLTGASYGGVLYFFGQTAGGTTYYQSYNGSWSGWLSLGGVLGPSHGVGATSNRLIVAGTAGAGNLYNNRYSGSWTGWGSLGGSLATGPEVVGVGSNAYAFGVGVAGVLYYRLWNGTSWDAWISLGGMFAVGN